MKRLIFIIFTLMILCGCTPQRKLARLVKRYPELITRVDTLVIRDSVIRAGEYKEILINLPCPDLLQIADNKTGIALATTGARADLSFKDSALLLQLTQYPDTVFIYQEVEVPIYSIQEQKKEQSKYSWFDKVLFAFMAIAAFALILLFIRGLLTDKLLR